MPLSAWSTTVRQQVRDGDRLVEVATRRPNVAFFLAAGLAILLLAGLILFFLLPLALVTLALAAIAALLFSAYAWLRRKLSGGDGRRNVKIIVRDEP